MIESDEQKISEDSKKISVLVPLPLIQKMKERGLTQTEAVNSALEIYFSEDLENISSYKNRILEDEKKIITQEAQLSEFSLIKLELERTHQLLDTQQKTHEAHMAQVQSLIEQLRAEGRQREDQRRSLEDKILLLEDGKNQADIVIRSKEDEIRKKEEIIISMEDKKKKTGLSRLIFWK